jgi:SAM-dependent methyltransferase
VREKNENTPMEWDGIWSKKPIAPHGGFLKILWKLIENYNPILDVGAGDGVYWQKRFCPFRDKKKITAVDFSTVALNKCAAIGLKTKRGDLNGRINFPDKSFDLAMATEVIEHLDNPMAGIEELIRLARRRVVVSCPNDDPATNKREHVWQISRGDIKGKFAGHPRVARIGFAIAPTWSRSNDRLVAVLDLKN